MSKMKIYTRLIVAFSIIIALALILGVFGAVMVNIVSAKATVLYEGHLIAVSEIGTVESEFKMLRLVVNRGALFAINGNIADVDTQKDRYLQHKENIASHYNTYAAIAEKSAQNEMNIFSSELATYYAEADVIFDTFKNEAANQNSAAIINALNVATSKVDGVETAIRSMISIENDAGYQANEDTNVFGFWATVIEIGLIVAITAFSMFIAMFIAGGVEKNLKNIIEKLSVSTMNISSSATQLTDASESLATGSSRQAAAIEETSATMNETASMVAQNAENTRVASQLAAEATAEVNESSRHTGEMTTMMAELKESSDKVSRIVKTIDDIAFQTNLLAINATVEAARAGGEAGRSFAVVAQEVRSLAQRSAGASAETSEIIERNIVLTDASRKSAERVMTLAQHNAQQIMDLGKLVSEISAASEEQASGIKQINIAMSQMEKVTQENAAVAEENAASSNSMRDEIANLDSAIAIAKSLVRSSDSESAGMYYNQRPGGSFGAGSNSGYRPAGSNSTRTVKNQTASDSNQAYKQAGSNTSNSSKKNEAEKIIPLDDNDGF